MSNWRVIHADCVEAMREMDEASVDAVVCDPPAGIGFMGKPWDGDKGGRDAWIAWLAEVMRECWRVAKPGAHALVWALPRTSHWTGYALEEAGWEVRDRIAHHFGSGFPKSHNLNGDWRGWGTALKPATEDWWLARKPLVGTVSENAQRFGTGAVNVDGCRVEGAKPHREVVKVQENDWDGSGAWKSSGVGGGTSNEGRWPANAVLSHLLECDGTCAPGCAVAELDRQSGSTGASGQARGPSRDGRSDNYSGAWMGTSDDAPFYGDTGGASRFIATFRYQPKASRTERNAGLEGFEKRRKKVAVIQTPGVANDGEWEDGKQLSGAAANLHLTVKPINLMCWLCRLVTSPGGTILDPFCGSGTTGCAAVLEDFDFIGIECEAEYVEIARARIEWWAQFPQGTEVEDALESGQRESVIRDSGQLALGFSGEWHDHQS